MGTPPRPRSIPGMWLQHLVLRAALIYDSGLPPASREITKNA
jgi:hypothetical protein